MNILVLQPNGKFARWSGKIQHFTHYNLKGEEADITNLFGLGEYGKDMWNWNSYLRIIEKEHNKYERERAERFGNE